MNVFIDALGITLGNNIFNLIILFCIYLVMVRVSDNTVVMCFLVYYVLYIIADYSMTVIELEVPYAYIEDYQPTWHILLAMVGALILFYLSIDVIINEHSVDMQFCIALTSVYIMLFYVVPNVGFSGLSSEEFSNFYNKYSYLGIVFDLGLIGLSVIKHKRGANECVRMAYEG